MADIQITTDLNAMDLDPIIAEIAGSYWAKDFSAAQIRNAFTQSHCVGLKIDGSQVGFARALSDQVMSAHIKDAIILPSFRGQGYGRVLIKALLDHPALTAVPKWHLGTKDAQPFYAKLGFQTSPDGTFMHLTRAFPRDK